MFYLVEKLKQTWLPSQGRKPYHASTKRYVSNFPECRHLNLFSECSVLSFSFSISHTAMKGRSEYWLVTDLNESVLPNTRV